ncbi:MAG: hypothetical protein JSS64_00695 [Bacteroidetes bacterium]|nr:hypothetical protein [Bacteroidota bacterium]
MKVVAKYVIAILCPGLALMLNKKLFLGIIFLLLQVASISWPFIRLIGSFAPGFALDVMSKMSIPFFLNLSHHAFFTLTILASFAVLIVWRNERITKSEKATQSTLS